MRQFCQKIHYIIKKCIQQNYIVNMCKYSAWPVSSGAGAMYLISNKELFSH